MEYELTLNKDDVKIDNNPADHVKRILDYKRLALIEGSIELLVKYMKEKKMKVLK